MKQIILLIILICAVAFSYKGAKRMVHEKQKEMVRHVNIKIP